MAFDKEMTTDVVVEDGDNFFGGNNGNASAKMIFLEQWRRCFIEGSKEMVRGGKKVKVVKGAAVEIDVPNQMEVFINCVKMLEAGLMPDVEVEKGFKEQLDAIDTEINDLTNNYIAKHNRIIERSKNISNKEMDNMIEDNATNLQIEQVPLYRKKFIVIGKLLKQIGYYEEQGVMG